MKLAQLIFAFLLPFTQAFGATWYFGLGSGKELKIIPEIEVTKSKGPLKCIASKVEIIKKTDGTFDEKRFVDCYLGDVRVSLGAGCPVKVNYPYVTTIGVADKKFSTSVTLKCGPLE